MRKKTPKSYSCLTLLKPDISELTQLFQNNLQDAEIIIDGIRIIDSMQFEQFDGVYQAKSLLARGFFTDDISGKGKRQLVELKISKQVAHLSFGCNEAGEPASEVIVHIRTLLVRCQNRFHQFLLGILFFCTFSLFIPIMTSIGGENAINHSVQLLLLGVGSFLVDLLLFLLLDIIVRLLKMDTLVFILPGAARTSQKYGQREIVGTLIVGLILIFVVQVIIEIAFSFL